MPLSAGTAVAFLTLDASGFTSGMTQAATIANQQFGNMENSAASKLTNLGQNMATMGAALTNTITRPVMALGKEIVEVGSHFEATMDQVRAVSGDAITGIRFTDEQMNSLSETAKELGRSTFFSAQEVAEGMVVLGKAGFDAEDILTDMAGILDAAAASGEDLNIVTDTLAHTLSIFGRDTITAQAAAHGWNGEMNASQIVADMFAAAANASTIDIVDMGKALEYCGPAAANLGIDLGSLSAAMVVTGNAGIEGSKAGTTLRRVLQNLSSGTGQANKALTELNLSAFDVQGNFKGLIPFLEETADKFSELTKEEQQHYANMIAGATGSSGFIEMLQAVTQNTQEGEYSLEQYAEAMWKAGGTAAETAAIMRDNLEGSLDIFGDSLHDLKTSIYEALGPSLKSIVDNANSWFDELMSSDRWPEIAKGISEFGEAAAKTINKIVDFVGKLITSIDGGKAKMLGYVTAIGAAAGPVLSVAGVLVAKFGDLENKFGILNSLAGLFGRKSDEIGSRGTSAFGKLSNAISNSANTFKSAWNNPTRTIQNSLTNLGTSIANLPAKASSASGGIKSAFSNIGKSIEGAKTNVSKFSEAFKGVDSSLKSGGLLSTIKSVPGIFSSAFGAAEQTATKSGGVFKKAFGDIGAAVELTKPSVSNLGGLFKTTFTNISTAASNVGVSLSQMQYLISSPLKNAVNTFVDGSNSKFVQFGETLIQKVGGGIDLARKELSTLPQAVANTASQFGGAFTQMTSGIATAFGGFKDKIIKAIDFPGLKSQFAQNIAEMGTSLKNMPSNIGAAFTGVGEKISASVLSKMPALSVTLGQWGGRLSDSFSTGFGMVKESFGTQLSNLSQVVTNRLPAFKQAFGDIGAGASLAFEQIGGVAGKAMQAVGTSISGIAPVAAKVAGPLASGFQTAFSAIAGGAKLFLGGTVIGVIAALVGGFMHLMSTSEGFKNGMDAALKALGDAFKGLQEAVKPIMDTIKKALGDTFNEFCQNIGPLFIGIINQITFILNDLTTAFSGVLSGGAANEQFLKFHSILTQVNAILTDLLNIATEVLGGIAALMTGDVNGAAEHLKGVFDGINQLFNDIANTLTNIVGDAFTNFGQTLKDLGLENIGQLFIDLGNGIKDMGDRANEVGTFIQGVIDTVRPPVEEFMQAAGERINDIIHHFDELIGAIRPVVEYIVSVLAPYWQAIFTAIGQVVGVVFEYIGVLINSFLGWLDGLIQFVTGVFSGNWDQAWNGIKTSFKSIIDSIGKVFTDLFPKLLKAIGDFLGKAFTTMANIGRAIVQGLWNGITSLAEWIGGKIKGFFDGIIDGAKSILGIHSPSTVFKSMGEDTVAGYAEGVDGASGDAKASVDNMFNGVKDSAELGMSDFKNILNGSLDDVKLDTDTQLLDFNSMFGDSFGSLPTEIDPALADLSSTISTGFSELPDTAVESLTPLSDKVKEVFDGMKMTIEESMTAISLAINEGFTQLSDLVNTSIPEVTTAFGNSFTEMKNAVVLAMAESGASVHATTTVMGEELSAMATLISESASELTENVHTTLVTFASQVNAEITTMQTLFTRRVNEITLSVTTSINALSTSAINAVGAMSSQVQNTVTTMASNVVAAFTRMQTSAQNTVNQLNATISASFSTTFKRVQAEAKTFSTNIATQFRKAAVGVTTALSTNLPNAERVVRDSLRNMLTEAKTFASEFGAQGALAADRFRTAITNGMSGIYSEMSNIGYNISLGLASGISSGSGAVASAARSAVTNAVAAARAAGDIRSPSRVFANEVGVYIPLGIAKGIMDSKGKLLESISMTMNDISFLAGSKVDNVTDEVTKRLDRMGDKVKALLKKQKNQITRWWKNYYTDRSKQIEEQIDKLEDERDAEVKILNDANTQLKKDYDARIAYLDKAYRAESDRLAAMRDLERDELNQRKTNLSNQLAEDKQAAKELYNAEKEKNDAQITLIKESFGAQIDEWKERKSTLTGTVKQIGNDVIGIYTDAIESVADILQSEIEDAFDKINDAYDEAMAEVEKKMESMQSKMASYGDLFTSETKKFRGQPVEIFNLGDLEAQTQAIIRYGQNLEALKGRISEELMDEILDMGIDDATKYTNALLSMTDEEFERYNNLYNEKIRVSNEITKKFYASKVEEIQKNYVDEVERVIQETLEKIKGFIPSVIEEINENLKDLEIDTDALEYFYEINKNLPTIFNKLLDFDTIMQGNGFDNWGDAFMDYIVGGIERAFGGAGEDTGEKYAYEFIDGMAQGIERGTSGRSSQWSPQAVNTVMERFGFNEQRAVAFLEYGKKCGLNYSKGIEGAIGELSTSALDAMVNGLDNYIREKFGEMYNDVTLRRLFGGFEKVGKAINDGLADGLDSEQIALAFSSGLVKTTEDELEINSPSKVFEQLGAYTAEGFNNGLSGIPVFAGNLFADLTDSVGETTDVMVNSLEEFARFTDTVASSIGAAAKVITSRYSQMAAAARAAAAAAREQAAAVRELAAAQSAAASAANALSSASSGSVHTLSTQSVTNNISTTINSPVKVSAVEATRTATRANRSIASSLS